MSAEDNPSFGEAIQRTLETQVERFKEFKKMLGSSTVLETKKYLANGTTHLAVSITNSDDIRFSDIEPRRIILTIDVSKHPESLFENLNRKFSSDECFILFLKLEKWSEANLFELLS